MVGINSCLRLTRFVINSTPLANIPVYVWVDSQITLYWIRSSKTLPQFVTHQVEKLTTHCLQHHGSIALK